MERRKKGTGEREKKKREKEDGSILLPNAANSPLVYQLSIQLAARPCWNLTANLSLQTTIS